MKTLILLTVLSFSGLMLSSPLQASPYSKELTPFSISDSLPKPLTYSLSEIGAKRAIETFYELTTCRAISIQKDSIIKHLQLKDLTKTAIIYHQDSQIKGLEKSLKHHKIQKLWANLERWAFRGAAAVVVTLIILKQ